MLFIGVKYTTSTESDRNGLAIYFSLTISTREREREEGGGKGFGIAIL